MVKIPSCYLAENSKHTWEVTFAYVFQGFAYSKTISRTSLHRSHTTPKIQETFQQTAASTRQTPHKNRQEQMQKQNKRQAKAKKIKSNRKQKKAKSRQGQAQGRKPNRKNFPCALMTQPTGLRLPAASALIRDQTPTGAFNTRQDVPWTAEMHGLHRRASASDQGSFQHTGYPTASCGHPSLI